VRRPLYHPGAMDTPFPLLALPALLALLLALPYAGLLVRYGNALRRLGNRPTPEADDDELPAVTVVVAARDEAEALPGLLEALGAQDYPAGRMEVVVADDRSRDDTPEVLSGAAVERPGQVRSLCIEHLPEGWTGKKWALEQAVRAARGEVVLVIDADCRPGSGWVRAAAIRFAADPALDLLAGPVDYLGAQEWGWPRRLLRTEFLALSLAGAGAIATGGVLVASSQNLAFRRDLFERLGGFAAHAAIPSGDDVFLLFAASEAGAGIDYQLDPAGLVRTRPPEDTRAFWHPRARWASKGVRYPRGPFLVSLLVWLENALLLAGGISLLTAPLFPAWALLGAALAVKGAGDLRLLTAVRFPGQRGVVTDYLTGLPAHIPYITLFGLAGPLGLFRWR
jgi:biofilm PGA synthesis N-glycosyltransferase PgaC